MLLLKKDQYAEAKMFLPQLKNNRYKWYYGAVIALEEDNKETFRQFKARLKDTVYREWLELEEKVRNGQKAEALTMLDEQMTKLRGLKLLSAVQYRKELLQK